MSLGEIGLLKKAIIFSFFYPNVTTLRSGISYRVDRPGQPLSTWRVHVARMYVW